MRPRRYAIYMYCKGDQYPADDESVQRVRIQRSTGKILIASVFRFSVEHSRI